MAEPITVTIQGLNSPIATVKVQNKLSESAVTSVNGKIGDVSLTNADIPGLENVNNTSDLDKPISTATQAAIDSISFTGDYSPTGHQHVLADITNAGTAAAANVGDFATASHQHLLSHITNAGTAAASDVGDFAAASHTHVLADITNLNTGNFASSAQGTLADSAVQPGDGISSLVNDAGYLTGVGDVLTSGSIDTLAKINNILTTPDLIDITDSRLTDARTPTSHASSHTNGTDDIQDATTGQKGLATAAQIQKLDGIEALADVTDATNVAAAGAQMTSQKGVAGGYAGLDGGGKVPSAQLPSYVDDVLEYPFLAAFPNPGEVGKIYVDLTTNKIYRWSGSTYIEISNGGGTTVTSVNTFIGDVVLDADDISDSSTTNKFTTTSDIIKLGNIEENAQVNVNADWEAINGDAQILNKPPFGSMTGANTGDYSLTGHTHTTSDILGLGTMALEEATDYSLTTHTHNFNDVIGLGTMASANTGDYSPTGHQHELADIIGAGTSAAYDVANGGDAGLTEVVLGSDTRLVNARTPTNHASSHVDGLDQIQSATTGQRGLATAAHIQALSGALQSGDNVSLLTNDANYTSSGDNVSLFVNDSLYVASGDNISQFNNDAGYITSADAGGTYFAESAAATYKALVPATGYTYNGIEGNVRGNNSVDLQIRRTAQTEVAAAAISTIVGGQSNFITANGALNSNGQYSAIIGGLSNRVNLGQYSTIIGGYDNEIGATEFSGPAGYSVACGASAKAKHPNTFVFGDNEAVDFESLQTKTFNIHAANGLRLITDGNQSAGQVLTCDANGHGTWQSAAGGDMLESIYDPNGVSGDAFAMDNMVEGANTKIFTSGERDKLSGIAAGAEVNVNADWTAVGGDAEILNKPAFGDITGSNIADFATSGQGALADSAIQPSDNISLLTNDSGYINFPSVYSYTEETGNYNISTTDYTVNCTSGAQTITLPTAVGIQGQVFVVKNSSTGVITITGTASQTIDGYNSIETDFPQSLTLQSTNTNWIII